MEQLFQNFDKPLKIRISRWIELMIKVQANLVWKSNRNNCAKLLVQMVKDNHLQAPFDKLPSSDTLPVISNSKIAGVLQTSTLEAIKQIDISPYLNLKLPEKELK